MLLQQIRQELEGCLKELTDPNRLPIDNVRIERSLIAALRALIALDDQMMSDAH